MKIEGDNVNISGTLVYHDKYGEQINVDSISLVKPNDKTGIINFLANSNIKGIGKKKLLLIYIMNLAKIPSILFTKILRSF